MDVEKVKMYMYDIPKSQKPHRERNEKFDSEKVQSASYKALLKSISPFHL